MRQALLDALHGDLIGVLGASFRAPSALDVIDDFGASLHAPSALDVLGASFFAPSALELPPSRFQVAATQFLRPISLAMPCYTVVTHKRRTLEANPPSP